MPLFRSPQISSPKTRLRRQKRTGDTGDSLVSLCLDSLVENMKDIWTRDYAEKYMDHYCFRYIMGPFSILPAELLERIICLLCSRRLLTRTALHLLLEPALRRLSLSACPGLVNASICHLIAFRCQNLQSLDVSGAQQLSPMSLSEMLGPLVQLRRLCLSGTQCDGRVIQSLVCSSAHLQHLDVSHCSALIPADLLPLARLPTLRSLLALDLGLEDRTEGAGVASFLLLSLPFLLVLAMDSLGEACEMIDRQNFEEATGLTPSLWQMWDSRVQQKHQEEKDTRVDEDWLSERESEEEDEEDESKSCSVVQTQTHSLTLCLIEAQGVSCEHLDAVGRLCPHLRQMSVMCEDSTIGKLSVGLQPWVGQLLNLNVHFPGALSAFVPAAQVVSQSLRRLSLQGVRVHRDASLLHVLSSCPRLQTLLIHTEPPVLMEEDEEEEGNGGHVIQNFPRLPELRSLTLHFFIDPHVKKPLMSWRSLRWFLWAFLSDCVLLEEASLVGMPCPVDEVFLKSLRGDNSRRAEVGQLPLQHLRSLSLAYCDVSSKALAQLLSHCSTLSSLSLTGCWNLSSENIFKLQSKCSRRRNRLNIIYR